jgi:hypothetical protein
MLNVIMPRVDGTGPMNYKVTVHISVKMSTAVTASRGVILLKVVAPLLIEN